MSTYPISRVYADDARGLAAVDELLKAEGIRRDAHLDYTCAMFENDRAIATGSCFGNTLRCLAVAHDHQGECLMNEIVTHLTEIEAKRGCYRLFLYTKCDSARIFATLGFYEVARAKERVVLMENRKDGFSNYLAKLSHTRVEGARSSAVVINANPFTNGHLHLVQVAAAASDVVHLFVVSEDASLFPFSVRWRLVREGVATISNVVLHDSGPYMVSKATFPSYFLGDSLSVATSHAELDAAVFCRIAHVLGVTQRFCGEEPTSTITATYNKVMARELPAAGIRFMSIPRLTAAGGATLSSADTAGLEVGNAAKSGTAKTERPVSASSVRQLLKAGNLEAVRPLVPPTTFAYLCSAQAQPILERIRATDDVVHH